MSSNQIPKYIRYVPAQDGAQPKIIRMVEVQKDPMEPSRFKINQKVPVAPPSPPVPVMHSPPRKITAEEQKQWKIPPCVSSWKNPKGYVVPLDKRCAFNGKTANEPEPVNHKFAQLSETLFIANRQHREALEERMRSEKLMAQKEKEKNQEALRLLAQQARHERAAVKRGIGYGRGGHSDNDDDDGDLEEEREREREREQRHRDRLRNINVKSSSGGKRTRFDRERERDISEQIALGVARPTNADDDQRLHDLADTSLGDGFGDDEDYAVYDRPWKSEASFSKNYRPSDGVRAELDSDRDKESIPQRSTRDYEPLEFHRGDDEVVDKDTKEVEDAFNVESFLRAAKYNANKNRNNNSK